MKIRDEIGSLAAAFGSMAADIALYRAKSGGRNRVVAFEKKTAQAAEMETVTRGRSHG